MIVQEANTVVEFKMVDEKGLINTIRYFSASGKISIRRGCGRVYVPISTMKKMGNKSRQVGGPDVFHQSVEGIGTVIKSLVKAYKSI